MGEVCSSAADVKTENDMDMELPTQDASLPDQEAGVVPKAAETAEVEPFDIRLAKAFKLPMKFEGVNTGKFNFDKDTNKLDSNCVNNLQKIAETLKESPETSIRIFGYAGSGDHKKVAEKDKALLVRLSLLRTRVLRQNLEDLGCTNKVAAKGMGHCDSVGPRCELALCSAEEVDVIEAEAKALEDEAKKLTPAPAPDGPGPGVVIKFVNLEGQEVDVTFDSKPLGFSYGRINSPMKITTISDDGCVKQKSLDVKVGYTIRSINQINVSGMALPEAMEVLKKAADIM